jgi:hypothetical protein
MPTPVNVLEKRPIMIPAIVGPIKPARWNPHDDRIACLEVLFVDQHWHDALFGWDRKPGHNSK